MNKKTIVAVFSIITLFSSTQVFAETEELMDIRGFYEYDTFESGYGELIQTNKIAFEVGRHGDVHVTHIVTGEGWSQDEPKIIKMLPGEHSNLQVWDEDKDYLRPIGFIGETFAESEYVILGQKLQPFDLLLEYDLENYLELNDSGMWTKHFQFPHDTMIYFDDEIELVFVHSRPIDVSDVRGFNCIGCDLKIEFFDKLEPIIKKVVRNENKFEEISDVGKEFTLEFFSDGEIDKVNFIDELNYLSFNVNKENQLVSMKIPLDLLLSPYHVYLSKNDQDILLESDQIRKTEFLQTTTHANLSFRGNTEGIIHVVGATEMEHEKHLSVLESKIPVQDEEESNSGPKLTSNLPQTITELAETNESGPNTQYYEEWENKTNTNNNDNTVIFGIIGIIGIVAAIIVVIIIKSKKN